MNLSEWYPSTKLPVIDRIDVIASLDGTNFITWCHKQTGDWASSSYNKKPMFLWKYIDQKYFITSKICISPSEIRECLNFKPLSIEFFEELCKFSGVTL
jgi:hypothetical protein